MKNKYYWTVSNTPDGDTLIVTEQNFWNANKHMSDNPPDELRTFMDSNGLYELQDSEYEVEDAAAVKALLNANPNFDTNDEHDEFLACDEDDY